MLESNSLQPLSTGGQTSSLPSTLFPLPQQVMQPSLIQQTAIQQTMASPQFFQPSLMPQSNVQQPLAPQPGMQQLPMQSTLMRPSLMQQQQQQPVLQQIPLQQSVMQLQPRQPQPLLQPVVPAERPSVNTQPLTGSKSVNVSSAKPVDNSAPSRQTVSGLFRQFHRTVGSVWMRQSVSTVFHGLVYRDPEHYGCITEVVVCGAEILRTAVHQLISSLWRLRVF